MRKGFLALSMSAVSTLLLSAVVGCGTAPEVKQGANKAADATTSTQTVNFYNSMDKKDTQSMIDEFTKETGIKVNVMYKTPDQLVPQIMDEAKAHKLGSDIIMVSHEYAKQIDPLKITVPYNGKDWVEQSHNYLVLGYNTDKVKNPPKTYQDLLDPKWKGQLTFETTSPEWEKTLEPVLGKDYFTKLTHDQDIKKFAGKLQLKDMVASGETPIAINIGEHMITLPKEQGAKVDWVALEPVVERTTVMALTSQNESAKKFMDFMLSPTAQKIVVKMGKAPVIDIPGYKNNLEGKKMVLSE